MCSLLSTSTVMRAIIIMKLPDEHSCCRGLRKWERKTHTALSSSFALDTMFTAYIVTAAWEGRHWWRCTVTPTSLQIFALRKSESDWRSQTSLWSASLVFWTTPHARHMIGHFGLTIASLSYPCLRCIFGSGWGVRSGLHNIVQT
jgi:hypothetical protein